MERDNKYTINSEVIKNYVNTIKSINMPMEQLKKQLDMLKPPSLKALEEAVKTTNSVTSEFNKSFNILTNDNFNKIKLMSDSIKEITDFYPREQNKIFSSVMHQIMKVNNGMISTRMIEPLNISRQYLSLMEQEKLIEKASRGIYVLPEVLEDSYYLYQQKYKKAIFSHMTALYFYGMTEELPYTFSVTVPQNYHVDSVNENCNVFYVNDDIYELGVCEVDTPSGNKVKAYDVERCICDIIRSMNRMDQEHVKKAIRQYVKSKNKDINKLSSYAKQMRISNKVMETVGMYFE